METGNGSGSIRLKCFRYMYLGIEFEQLQSTKISIELKFKKKWNKASDVANFAKFIIKDTY